MVERIGWSLNVQFALGTAFPRIAADGVTNERARLEVDGVPPESIWRLSFMQALVVRPGTLRDLPGASVSALRRLRTLRVSRNRLVSLPSSIASLESLEGLFVDGNALAGLPDEVGRLGALRTLEAHDNSLAALPPGLCDATALCRLTLRNNLLAALPGALGRLRRLSLLDVENNRLASLPESLAEIPALRELRLAGNRVTRLPAGLGATPLEKLFAQDNDLRRVDGLGASLRALNLENGPDKPGRRGGTNALSSLPPLGELTRLGVLFVAGLGLADLPDLSPLASLRVLLAGDNALRVLPEGLPGALETLHVERNKLEALPAALAKLARLERLVASTNRLAALPTNVGDLGRSLRVVHLDSNPLASLPASAADWANVSELLLFDTRVAALPPAARWAALETLYARGARLAALPALAPFSKARVVELSANKLVALPADVSSALAQTTHLILHDNNLAKLPSLAALASLRMLLVDGNRLSELPDLPSGLRVLDATRNRLVAVGSLPENLRMLGLGQNHLATLPPLGDGLHTLLLGDNLFTDAPAPGARLRILGLHRNPLRAPPPPEAETLDVDVDDAPSRHADLCRDNLERAAPACLDVVCTHGFRVDGNRARDCITLYRGTAATRGDRRAPATTPRTKRVVVNGNDATWPTDYDAAAVDDAYADGRHVYAQNLDRSRLDADRSDRTRWIPIGLDLRATYDIYHRRQRHVLLAVQEHDDARAILEETADAAPRSPRPLVTWSRDSTTSERMHRLGYASRRDLFDDAVASGADVVLGDRDRVWRAMAAAKFVLSPVGAGFDCYRTWEGLFFGAIVIAQRCPLEREFNAAKLPVVFVDDFRFQQADLDRWAADHAPITSPDDPRLKRDAYLPPPE